MRHRPFICLLLVLAAIALPAAPAVAQDNEAEAINTTDAALVFDLAVDLQSVAGGRLEPSNVAEAYASCDACRTIAIAIQVVLVMAETDYLVPVNYAEAINENCTSCETLAYAAQFVFATGGRLRLTGQARKRLLEIERELAALEESDASLLEIQAEIDRLTTDLRDTLVDGVQTVGNTPAPAAPTSAEEDAETATGSNDPAATSTPAVESQTTPLETATPEPTPESTPEPDPTATPEATPTETATPEATPTPEGTATPESNPEATSTETTEATTTGP